jgi:hypothetical protein
MNQMPEWSVTTYADYVKAALGVLTGQPQSLVVNPKFTYCWPHGSASEPYDLVVGFNCADENACKNLAEKINAIRKEMGDYGIIAYTNKKSLTVCIDPYNHSNLEDAVNRVVKNYCDANPSQTLLDNNARYSWNLFHRGSR